MAQEHLPHALVAANPRVERLRAHAPQVRHALHVRHDLLGGEGAPEERLDLHLELHIVLDDEKFLARLEPALAKKRRGMDGVVGTVRIRVSPDLAEDGAPVLAECRRDLAHAESLSGHAADEETLVVCELCEALSHANGGRGHMQEL